MKPEIRLARTSDSDRVVAFIDRFWSPGHIFTRDRSLFDWQHSSAFDPHLLNFVLGEDPASNELLAVMGFIPMSQFSRKIEWTETALALWIARREIQFPGLGLLLPGVMEKELKPAMIFAVGLSKMVLPIYKSFGYTTGLMDHHVLFNSSISSFEVAAKVSVHYLHKKAAHAPHCRAVFLNGLRFSEFPLEKIEVLCAAFAPRKGWNYVVNRYLRHPVYHYGVVALQETDSLKAMLVIRKIQMGSSVVLRIVDFFGDASVLFRFAGCLQDVLQASNAEYIDIYQTGIEPRFLEAAGFVDRHKDPDLIIPNYFEPFEQRNVDLEFAYKISDPLLGKEVRFFRGDSDQDRPNIVPAGKEGASA